MRQVLFGCVFILACVAGLAFARANESKVLYVYFLDVGQGDSIYVRSPSGGDMLIDGGKSVSVLRRLSEVMPWNDRRIDVLVETHPDTDHIGGFPPIINRYDVGAFVEPGIESSNGIDEEIHRLLGERNIPVLLGRRGMVVDFGDGSAFQILFPDRDVSGLRDTNDASIVGSLRFGSTSIMLTGDAPKSTEDILVRLDGASLKSDILKAGHHGSKTSSGETFIGAVNPDAVIFSVGKGNTYHHPNKDVVALFDRLGIKAFRTDEMGTVGFESDGRGMVRIR